MTTATSAVATLETLDELESIDETPQAAVATPRVDLLAKWFDQTEPLADRKAARRLFFGSLCERGTHRMGAPIRPNPEARFDNPMVGEPTYYRIDQPRRACDIHGSGKIYEYTLRQEAYEFDGEPRQGYVVDVFDLGLNATESRHIGVVRNENGQPFTNQGFAYGAVLAPNGRGWLQRRWDWEAEQFRQSDAGQAQLAKIDAHFVERDRKQVEAIQAAAKRVNQYAAEGNAAKAAGDMETYELCKLEHAAAKATWAALKAEREGLAQPAGSDARPTGWGKEETAPLGPDAIPAWQADRPVF